MNAKFINSAIVTAFLLGSLVSGRAQAVPDPLPPVLPPPGAVMMQSAGEVHGFQIVSGEASVSTQVVKGAPYSLEASIETVQALADGNRIVHRQTVHLYRDSKGRTRREETLAAIGPWAASGEPPTMITIQDPVSGVSYFLDPRRKTAATLPAAPIGKSVMVTGGMVGGDAGGGPATVRIGSGPVGGGFVSSGGEGQDAVFGFHTASGDQGLHLEEKSESLGKETIAGISGDGTRTTTTIPANAMGNERPLDIVRERWYSPDLQIVLRSKQTDPRFGETTYEATRVDRGEPALTIFEVPSDYKITKGDAHFIVKHDPDPK
jgi:hypothetical protein